ncbi:RICIN domain-containing protein [Streptomyces sp. NPDC058525]|uniref:RICIN domain-containing protein n=1 Tax=Streptomyces sp. NPDC058525 TaxID=3346538 RepID=UPI0036541563
MNLSEGLYRIRNVDSGLVLQLEGASRVRVGPDGPPAPEAARRWRISPVHSGGGIFHVVSEDNERRLDVANASTDSGARVQVWPTPSARRSGSSRSTSTIRAWSP